MVVDRVREVFERRRQQPFEPQLAGVRGSYRFDVEGVGSFFVSVDDGALVIVEAARDADCVIACDPTVFLRVADGSQNLLTAAMQGLVEISGDLALAQRLHGILPAPSDAHAGDRP
jgi:putative sterol carrier protein